MKNKLSLLLIVCIVSIIFMLAVLYIKPQTVNQMFTPPPFETEVQTGIPVVDQKLGYTTLKNDSMSFSLSICGKPIVVGDTSEIYLTNNEDNNVWIKLRVLDENSNILAETGLIKPDEYLKDIKFDVIPKDNDKIILKIMSYEIDTYYSMGTVSLNTKIKVDK